MATFARLLPSSWFSNGSSAAAQKLVEAREASLADNTREVDELARLRTQLRGCFEAVKKANPALFENLKRSPNQELSEKEMAEQLKIIALATQTNLDNLSKDLQEVRDRRLLLAQLLEIWERIEKHFDRALENGAAAEELDKKNVQDLTELREKLPQLGVSPTCHT